MYSVSTKSRSDSRSAGADRNPTHRVGPAMAVLVGTGRAIECAAMQMEQCCSDRAARA